MCTDEVDPAGQQPRAKDSRPATGMSYASSAQGKDHVRRPELSTTVDTSVQKLTTDFTSKQSVRHRREGIGGMCMAAEEQCKLAMPTANEEEATLQEEIENECSVRTALVTLQAAVSTWRQGLSVHCSNRTGLNA